MPKKGNCNGLSLAIALLPFIDTVGIFIDDSLIDGVGAGVVDDLAEQDSVLDRVVEVLALVVQRQKVL